MGNIKIVGQTKNVGFQIGVRKTLPISIDIASDFLFSDEGLEIWLGKINVGRLEINGDYKTKDGIEGRVSVLKRNSHIRLTWKPKQWTNVSTLQIRVIEAKDKTTISFHQEKLLDGSQREEMKKHWDKVIETLAEKIIANR
jgi:uncharacterized protein YndB with AHSA1/START domain